MNVRWPTVRSCFSLCAQRAPEAVWTKSLPRLMRAGMLAREDGRLYLTARGMQVMNAVLVEMMEETEA